ncbi:hypothetical protein X560_1031 [Listeria fleischmannii 1991]|jgi:xanthine/uracil permease|uniref:Protein of uncharacterized function (DUF3188) n=4 Tax=Listeria fleischmannii TaxID=1069827 RepID=A0A2X3H7M2_9LIST|nr:DUF3188 domain-containing protein [Listeria fleischmannii]EIA19858.1 hypothetical protein KKC_10112 [Listeria fleischmannii subsp. coloradonensis]EMG28822.1 hypothetical protein LFLEISCH_03720 [Listeria fleischmannii subsp. fleischmannii LU2006-1]EUJ52974.1 hypothetical protein MCOL2_11942 [Listeria fleischmannii FSL S10-1203]KMT60105.1 hypothetical protein X560_1031 [Listeria fleischmannii 1991]MBC1398053.1 DUF3188 domain-containing protein [Listeria fleischmannii]
MKIANGLFIMSIGLLIIMMSPSYGKNGAANMPFMITGIVIVVIGAVLVFIKVKKGKNKDGQGGDKK